MKFLVFFTDVLPLSGIPTSGTPLRTHGLVQGLRAHGHEVETSVPRAALEGMLATYDLASFSAEVRSEIATLRDTAFDFTNQSSLMRAVRPDVVLCGHWPAATFSERIAPLSAFAAQSAVQHLSIHNRIHARQRVFQRYAKRRADLDHVIAEVAKTNDPNGIGKLGAIPQVI